MTDDKERSEGPVTVAECYGHMEASVVQSKLAGAGIRSYRRGQVAVYPTAVDGLGRMEIQVAAPDAAAARDILESVD